MVALKTNLAAFCGGGDVYRHPLNRNFMYTEGAKYFADNAGAHWFLDIVATELAALQADEGFIVASIAVANSRAVITATDGNTKTIFFKRIEFTDCPEGNWKFYLVDYLLMLPNEY